MNSIKFSYIEKDLKTYNYIKEFIDFFEKKESEDIISLENDIQSREIKTHLYLNKIPDWDKNKQNKEKILWSDKYGEDFRHYLNAMKIIALVFVLKDYECFFQCVNREFTFDNFCKIVDDYNRLKFKLIDSFF
jgi:hypothetical protein